LLIGDSVAFGSGVPYEKSLAPALESTLDERFGKTVGILNAAVPGYNTNQESILLEALAPDVRPDVIVVAFCMNDYLDPPRLTHSGTLDATGTDRDLGFSPIRLVTESRTFVFTKEKIKDLQKARPEWFPVWTHYVRYLPNHAGWQRAQNDLLRIQLIAQNSGARLLLVIFPIEPQLRLNERSAQDDLLRFSRAHGIDALDLFSAFQKRWRDGLYIDRWVQAGSVDKLHLSERGHALAANEIGSHIIASFGRSGGRSNVVPE
jgi:lysophospholipase L1-like esterase